MGCKTAQEKLKRCSCGFESYCDRNCQVDAWSDHRALHRAAVSRERIAAMPHDSPSLRVLYFLAVKVEQTTVPLLRLHGDLAPDLETKEDHAKMLEMAHKTAGRIHSDLESYDRLLTEMLYRVFEESPDLDPVDLYRFLENRNSCPGYLTRVSLVAACNRTPERTPTLNGRPKTYLLGLVVAPTREVYETRMRAAGLVPGEDYSERLRDAGFLFTDDAADGADPSFTTFTLVEKGPTPASAAASTATADPVPTTGDGEASAVAEAGSG